MKQFIVLPIAAFAFACGAPTDDEYGRAAQGLGAMVADENSGETSGFSDAVVAVRGGLPVGFNIELEGKLTGTRGEITSVFEISGDGDLKLSWKGKSENEKWKLEIDRSANWKVSEYSSDVAKVNGQGQFKTKFASKTEEAASKYEFDYDAKYHDVLVRTSDNAVIGGTIEYDVHVKEMEKTDETKVKSDFKVAAEVAYDAESQAVMTLDSKMKYRVKSSGDVELE
jgi:hypothetical protein